MLQLIDLTGKIIAEKSLNTIEDKQTIHFEGIDLAVGSYFVHLANTTKHIPAVRFLIF